jgi:hypothetical protein
MGTYNIVRTPSTFVAEADKLNKLINDTNVPIMDRILSLCRLYRWYQGDIHMQARTITRIEDLIKAV